MPLQKKDERRIRKNFKILVNDLKITNILDSLVSEDVLSSEDYDKINTKPVQNEKNRELVWSIIRGKPEGYAAFIRCLREDDDGTYKYLADLIENTQIDDKDTVEETFDTWVGDRLPPEKSKQYLTDLHLLHFSKCINPANLSLVGTCFDFSGVDVQNIEYKHVRAPEAACHDLLVKWRNKHGLSAIVGTLMDKLYNAHHITPESVHDEKIWEALSKID